MRANPFMYGDLYEEPLPLIDVLCAYQQEMAYWLRVKLLRDYDIERRIQSLKTWASRK